jgi:hypothetical protein
MALLKLIESPVFASHDMAHPRRLMTVLRDQTGIPASAIERTIGKLTDVGWLPGGTDYLPRDAAMVLVALAASRSPSEAVAAIEAYHDAQLQMARVFERGEWRQIDLENAKAGRARRLGERAPPQTETFPLSAAAPCLC